MIYTKDNNTALILIEFKAISSLQSYIYIYTCDVDIFIYIGWIKRVGVLNLSSYFPENDRRLIKMLSHLRTCWNYIVCEQK